MRKPGLQTCSFLTYTSLLKLANTQEGRQLLAILSNYHLSLVEEKHTANMSDKETSTLQSYIDSVSLLSEEDMIQKTLQQSDQHL